MLSMQDFPANPLTKPGYILEWNDEFGGSDLDTRKWLPITCRTGAHLGGVWNCIKAELRQMVAQGSGAIVNCSSIGGMVGSKGRSAYSASKHGIIGLTQSAALEVDASCSIQMARRR